MPVAMGFKERRDQRRAHKASGNTVKVPAGTGGTVRDLRLFEEPYIFHPSPSHPLNMKDTPADLGDGDGPPARRLSAPFGESPNGIRTPRQSQT